jgi:vitamin B12 transporter
VVHGVESFLSAKVNHHVDQHANYNHTHALDHTPRLELLRRPRDMASATADWRATDLLSFSATGRYVSSWIDGNRSFTIARLNAPPYATFDFSGDYRLNDKASFFARVENLLDRRYQQPIGFLAPGRAAYAGVRLKFGS